MRIATWNLERGGRTAAAGHAQERALRDVAADVLILTEPGPSYVTRPGVVTSPPQRTGKKGAEPWIAVVGNDLKHVALDIPFERMAVAATACVNAIRVAIYASVLPWGFIARDAPAHVREGENALAAFLRVLDEQVADIEKLRRRTPDHLIIWAGDFNQTVAGPNHGGSNAKRHALMRALNHLGLVAWNGDAAHAKEGLHAIDLICGSCNIRVKRQGRIDPMRDGVKMTDHAGYWIVF